ncbi:MAG: hypothetical protein IJY71_04455, partial [Clostridia bacterium]|nr:hypothetical protein [Clostridia bacterium]
DRRGKTPPEDVQQSEPAVSSQAFASFVPKRMGRTVFDRRGKTPPEDVQQSEHGEGAKFPGSPERHRRARKQFYIEDKKDEYF